MGFGCGLIIILQIKIPHLSCIDLCPLWFHAPYRNYSEKSSRIRCYRPSPMISTQLYIRLCCHRGQEERASTASNARWVCAGAFIVVESGQRWHTFINNKWLFGNYHHYLFFVHNSQVPPSLLNLASSPPTWAILPCSSALWDSRVAVDFRYYIILALPHLTPHWRDNIILVAELITDHLRVLTRNNGGTWTPASTCSTIKRINSSWITVIDYAINYRRSSFPVSLTMQQLHI